MGMKSLPYRSGNFCSVYGQYVGKMDVYQNEDATKTVSAWIKVGRRNAGASPRAVARLRIKGYNNMAEGIIRDWFPFAWVHLEGKIRATDRWHVQNGMRYPFTYIEVERYMVDDVTGPRQWHYLITQRAHNKLKRLALIGRKHLLSQGKNVSLANIEDIKEVFGDDPID